MRWTVLIFGWTTACGCTEIGCLNSIALTIEHDGIPATDVSGTATLGDTPFDIDCSTPAPPDSTVGCDQNQVFITGIVVDDRTTAVTVDLSTAEGPVVQTLDLDWDGNRPNGRRCPIACWTASATVDSADP